MKGPQNKVSTVRKPLQERARQKVELILEAAIRLLDKGGLAVLTTNAVAEKAGVSIGTLYQYFPNKDAILDALADREMLGLSARVLIALDDPSARSPQDRVGQIMRAVAVSYGERQRVHRIVIEYSLSRGGKRMAPLIARIIALLTSPDRQRGRAPMSAADAFVLTNAFLGVMRAIIMHADDTSLPPLTEIEQAMTLLFTGFVEPSQA
jgi:AcrR family transcriptional regulator